MRARKFGKGFIFTLDAFISLTLILFGIFTLILLLNAQKTYYTSYEQTYDLARDSLDGLDAFKLKDASQTSHITRIHDPLLFDQRDLENTPLEEIARLASLGDSADLQNAGAIADEFLNDTIPSQYCYRLDFFDVELNKWVPVNSVDRAASTSCTRPPQIQAAASKVVNGYELYDEPGGSPFSYSTCSGGKYPCGREQSTFVPGVMYGPTNIRLVVWI